jgi:hypothetical protein
MALAPLQMDTPLLLSPFASFRSVSPDVVEAQVGSKTHRLEPLECELALEFRAPRTVADLYASIETDADVADVRDAVSGLVALGVVSPQNEEDTGIEAILHPKTFADPTLLDRVGAAVAEGRAVAIPNAFDDELAERAYAGLSATRNWAPFERFDLPFFHYRHHNIYNPPDLPSEIAPFRRALGSRSTKARMTRLTGCDCEGDLALGASLYLPGDYSLPHTDGAERRSVAYVWYLTKEWKPDWGGHFVWCPTGAVANPAFNTLVVFRVDHRSLHFVAPVAPTAQGRRMAVNGWWTTKGSSPPRSGALPAGNWSVPLVAGQYGERSSRLDDDSGVVLL